MSDGAGNVAATERCVGGGNSRLRVGQVEEAGVANVIGVDAQQVVRGHIAQVIRREHNSPSDFALDTDVHLHRARRHILRSEQVGSGDVNAVRQSIPNVLAIVGRTLRQGECLVFLLQLHNLRSHASDRLPADGGRVNRAGERQGLRRAIRAHRRVPQEEALR